MFEHANWFIKTMFVCFLLHFKYFHFVLLTFVSIHRRVIICFNGFSLKYDKIDLLLYIFYVFWMRVNSIIWKTAICIN